MIASYFSTAFFRLVRVVRLPCCPSTSRGGSTVPAAATLMPAAAPAILPHIRFLLFYISLNKKDASSVLRYCLDFALWRACRAPTPSIPCAPCPRHGHYAPKNLSRHFNFAGGPAFFRSAHFFPPCFGINSSASGANAVKFLRQIPNKLLT